MRIVYNPEYLFAGFSPEKQVEYYKRVLDFSKSINYAGGITREIIDQFKLKKMRSTDTIFKFYLSNDGTRCLIKYEEKDSQIFEKEAGLVLLRATKHDEQGKYGRRLDKELIDYENFVLLEEDIPISDENAISNEKLDTVLGRQYMRNVFIDSKIDSDEFVKKMTVYDGHVVYKLSQNQNKSLDAKGPIFMLGCAGSGKTLVEVSKALKNAHSNIKQAYFTFTPMLRDVAEDIYNKYSSVNGIIGSTSFYCLKDYLLRELELTEDRYFSFERFKMWYSEEKFERKYKWLKTVGPVNLWTEIRGLIKGYVGNEYYRIVDIYQPETHIDLVDLTMLIENGILIKHNDSKSIYSINNESRFHDFLINHYPIYEKELIDRDILEPLLDERGYVKRISSSYSQYDETSRRNIYDFAKNIYQKHLIDKDSQRWFDDNDLARMFLLKIRRREVERLDFVIVDELQDLTEIQVFALTSLAIDPSNILMSGDVSQTINPTFFMLGRTGVIFRNRYGVTLNKEIKLDENYRNSESIVSIISELLDIRQNLLGKYSEDIREESRELEKRVGLPFFINTDNDSFFPVMASWVSVPKVAIIVASEETKKAIHKRLNLKQKSNIYTVQEAKGQEFEKIITYNIISEHLNEWEDILSGKIDKGSDLVYRYRYYFNLLYVAISRGRNNLFMYEDEKKSGILLKIIHLFESLHDNLEEVMNLREYDTEENRRIQAELHFRNEDYDRARTYYLQLDDKRMAALCTGSLFIQKGKFYEGVLHLYQFPDYYKKAYQYAKTKELMIFRLIMGYKSGLLSMDAIDLEYKSGSLVKMTLPFIGKPFYLQLLDDAITLMTEINKYRFQKKMNIIKLKEKFNG